MGTTAKQDPLVQAIRESSERITSALSGLEGLSGEFRESSQRIAAALLGIGDAIGDLAAAVRDSKA